MHRVHSGVLGEYVVDWVVDGVAPDGVAPALYAREPQISEGEVGYEDQGAGATSTTLERIRGDLTVTEEDTE